MNPEPVDQDPLHAIGFYEHEKPLAELKVYKESIAEASIDYKSLQSFKEKAIVTRDKCWSNFPIPERIANAFLWLDQLTVREAQLFVNSISVQIPLQIPKPAPSNSKQLAIAITIATIVSSAITIAGTILLGH